MMSIVARSARIADGQTDPVPDEVVARGRPPQRFLLRWRGEADPGTRRRSTRTGSAPPEHGLNASTFTGPGRRLDRCRLRRGAVRRGRRPVGPASRWGSGLRDPDARRGGRRRRRRAVRGRPAGQRRADVRLLLVNNPRRRQEQFVIFDWHEPPRRPPAAHWRGFRTVRGRIPDGGAAPPVRQARSPDQLPRYVVGDVIHLAYLLERLAQGDHRRRHPGAIRSSATNRRVFVGPK